MLKYWYKNIPAHHNSPELFWRSRLIAHSLLICTVYFFVLTVINIFKFNSYELALLDAVGLTLSILLYVWFIKSSKIKAVSWAVVLLINSLILTFIISINGAAYSLFWATLIPPFSFYLVGRNWGSLLSAVAFAVCAFIVYKHSQNPEPVKVGLGSVFNIIEVAIAHIILFRFYEKTRFAAYDTLAEKNRLIKKLAETDKLTGLFNREKLDRTLSCLLKSSNFGFILLDIDYFKEINDTYGHLEGDKALVIVASKLKSLSSSKAICARWGGEEFAIIIEGATLDETKEIATTIITDINNIHFHEKRLSVSGGVTINHRDDNTLTVIERADSALYRAKKNGRNRIEFIL